MPSQDCSIGRLFACFCALALCHATVGCKERVRTASEAASSTISADGPASEFAEDHFTPVLQIIAGNENRARIFYCGCSGDEPKSISRKRAGMDALLINGVPGIFVERSYSSHPGNEVTREATEYQNKVYIAVLGKWGCDVPPGAIRSVTTRDL